MYLGMAEKLARELYPKDPDVLYVCPLTGEDGYLSCILIPATFSTQRKHAVWLQDAVVPERLRQDQLDPAARCAEEALR